MKCATFNGNELTSGLDINTMIKGIDILSKRAPQASVESLPAVLIVGWSHLLGPGTIDIEQDGQVETMKVAVSKRGATAVILPVGSQCRLRPRHGSGCVVIITPSGEFSQAVGADSELIEPHAPRATDTPEQANARTWLRNENIGSSSLTLAHVLTGVPEMLNPHEFSVPLDSADFRRCARFFECVPSAREKISLMSAVSPAWTEMTELWPELETLYAARQADPSDRRLGDRMSALRDPPRRAPRP